MAHLCNAWLFAVSLSLLLFLMTSTLVTTSFAQGLAGGNSGKKNTGALDAASTHYIVLPPTPGLARERVLCLARGRCFLHILVCPKQCTNRKPKKNRIIKGCFIDCSSRCETTCKTRLPNCKGYGSVCYDPRFVGGDGVMFYFHGAKGGDFALVSDDQLQINAHFIGTRPEGRDRDFTWVQALAVMFESHTLIVSARRVATWDDEFDAINLEWDGHEIRLPNDIEAEWQIDTESSTILVERTAETNSVRVTVTGVLEMDVKVTPIGEEEDLTHGYHLPKDDVFAHLEMQFKFKNLTDKVEGVLGQTYRPGYISPVKRGIPMPMMGGEDRYLTPSLTSTLCGSCRFQRVSSFSSADHDKSAKVGDLQPVPMVIAY